MSPLKWFVMLLPLLGGLMGYVGNCAMTDHDRIGKTEAGLYWHAYGKPNQ